MVTVHSITGYTVEQIKGFTFPQRIAVQDQMALNNYHTAVLVVDAVTQDNPKVLNALISVAELHLELGSLSHELYEYRNWLSTLLIK